MSDGGRGYEQLKANRFCPFCLLRYTGWIKATDIGAPITEWMEKYAPETKPITLEEGAACVVDVLNGKTFEDSGLFFNYDGTKLPW